MNELHRAADAFVRGWELRDGQAVVDAARAAGVALAALGQDAALDIWTAPVRAAAALAEELGGTAKPSGAGGGDVGIHLGLAPPSRDFLARAEALHMMALDLSVDASGVRLLPSAPSGTHHG